MSEAFHKVVNERQRLLAKKETESIYIAGYRGKGFGSGFIKRFTFSRYSHVSVVFDKADHVLEYESIQGKDVHKQRFDTSSPDIARRG